ncbi:MAG: hypothetical protein PHI44_03470 [Candidatus Ratteibacteria bacterium]|nr:hypothetical protein [Candidatus Ratteibacteria bacterium]
MMEKLIKYIRIIDRCVVGIILELIYPLITFSAAALLCFLLYLTVFIKK